MYTFDELTISDLHKDARGFRPRGAFFEVWNQSDDDNRQAIWDGLIREYERREEEEARMEREALVEFDKNVNAIIDAGAGNRITALRWMTSTEEFYHRQCVEGWVYKQGILFTDYGRELVEELMHIVEFEDFLEEAC